MWSQILKYKLILQFKLALNWIGYYILKITGPCLIKNKETWHTVSIFLSLNSVLTDPMQFKPTSLSQVLFTRSWINSVVSVYTGKVKASVLESPDSLQLTQTLLWAAPACPNETLLVKIYVRHEKQQRQKRHLELRLNTLFQMVILVNSSH